MALLSPADQHHHAAATLASEPGVRVVTTEFVLIELANFFSAPARRRALPKLIDAIGSDPQTVLLPCSRALFRSGLTLFGSRHDKAWSLTDCTSFVVMRKRRIREALKADQHFEQAGFSALLR